jgi:hypothetical protein
MPVKYILLMSVVFEAVAMLATGVLLQFQRGTVATLNASISALSPSIDREGAQYCKVALDLLKGHAGLIVSDERILLAALGLMAMSVVCVVVAVVRRQATPTTD